MYFTHFSWEISYLLTQFPLNFVDRGRGCFGRRFCFRLQVKKHLIWLIPSIELFSATGHCSNTQLVKLCAWEKVKSTSSDRKMGIEKWNEIIVITIFVIPCSSFVSIMICRDTDRPLFCIGGCSVNTSLQVHVLSSVLNVSYSESHSWIFVTYYIYLY
jgi:hypothetical protein